MRPAAARVALGVAALGVFGCVLWIALRASGAELRPEREPGAEQEVRRIANPESSTPQTAPHAKAARVAVRPLHAPRVAEPPGFEEWIDQLVELGETAWLAAEDDDLDRAHEADMEAREEYAALRRTIHHPAERAIQAMFAVPQDDVSIRTRIRRSVLARIVSEELRDQWTTASYGGSRADSDSLVAAMLAAIPGGPALCEDLGGVLIDAPYLRSCHEGAVLDVVESATEVPHLHDVAEGLLRTLWRNLAEEGARSDSHLASLATMLLESDNPTERRAAILQLLGSGDLGRETVALEYLHRAADRELASHAVSWAASHIEPDRALAMIAELAPLVVRPGDAQGHALDAPLIALARRDPDRLRADYAQRLADDDSIALRAALVRSNGFESGDTRLAWLAFDHDRAIEVQESALFVLAAEAAPDEVERAFERALADGSPFTESNRLLSLVEALHNIDPTTGADVLRRIVTRIRSRVGADARTERALARLLGRAP